ncbi:MAG: hypothetical protein RBU37_19090 [Myxococcota bacterium]|nr:hypothetical protein [Myxococcota bacterium]
MASGQRARYKHVVALGYDKSFALSLTEELTLQCIPFLSAFD